MGLPIDTSKLQRVDEENGGYIKVRGRKVRGFERLEPEAILPARGTPKSAGYDIYAKEGMVIPPHETVLIKTGITAYMQDDEYLQLKTRSGHGFKGLVVGAGVIDADYYGKEIGVVIHNTTERYLTITAGERIAQGIFRKYLTADEDIVLTSSRGGGFGSTGRN